MYVESHKYLPRNRSLLNGRNEGWGPRWESSLVLLLLLVYSSTDDCSVLLLVNRKELLLAVEVHITEMSLSEVKKVEFKVLLCHVFTLSSCADYHRVCDICSVHSAGFPLCLATIIISIIVPARPHLWWLLKTWSVLDNHHGDDNHFYSYDNEIIHLPRKT